MVALDPDITAHTGLVAVLGHPVAHSLSPRMHNAAFRAQGLDLVYLAFDVAPRELPAAIEGVRSLGLRGVNVTVPHKEAVLRHVDEVDRLAAQVGAVNTVVNDRSRLVGYNTDVEGFRSAVRTLHHEGAHGLRCVVAGAGGAARAVVAALCLDGPAQISLFNRTTSRAMALCEDANTWGCARCGVVGHGDLADVVRSSDLLVNATTIGLSTKVKDSVFPVDILDSHHIVVDIVYGPQSTALVAAARAAGAAAQDGREMLVMQAAGAYRLWTGMEPPVDTMRESLDR